MANVFTQTNVQLLAYKHENENCSKFLVKHIHWLQCDLGSELRIQYGEMAFA